jgi:hypothetical protein
LTFFSIFLYWVKVDVMAEPAAELDFIDPIHKLPMRELLTCIEYGRTDMIKSAFLTLFYSVEDIPDISPSAIRSLKDTGIFLIGLTMSAAMKGGLDYDTALAVSYNYGRKLFFPTLFAQAASMPSESIIMSSSAQ